MVLLLEGCSGLALCRGLVDLGLTDRFYRPVVFNHTLRWLELGWKIAKLLFFYGLLYLSFCLRWWAGSGAE